MRGLGHGTKPDPCKSATHMYIHKTSLRQPSEILGLRLQDIMYTGLCGYQLNALADIVSGTAPPFLRLLPVYADPETIAGRDTLWL